MNEVTLAANGFERALSMTISCDRVGQSPKADTGTSWRICQPRLCAVERYSRWRGLWVITRVEVGHSEGLRNLTGQSAN